MIQWGGVMSKGNKMLFDARKQKGYSRKKLAQLSGVSQSSIKCYETGVRNPKIESLRKLAFCLNVSVDYLAGMSDVPWGNEKACDKRNLVDIKDKFINNQEFPHLIQAIKNATQPATNTPADTAETILEISTTEEDVKAVHDSIDAIMAAIAQKARREQNNPKKASHTAGGRNALRLS